MKCSSAACSNRASHAWAGADTRPSCINHKRKGMVQICGVACESLGYRFKPTYALKGDRQGRRCKGHMRADMVHANDLSCGVNDCEKDAAWTEPALSSRRVCRDRRSPSVEYTQRPARPASEGNSRELLLGAPSLTRASLCSDNTAESIAEKGRQACTIGGSSKGPDDDANRQRTTTRTGNQSTLMISAAPTCESPLCSKTPSFAPRGESRRRFCKQHALPGMVNAYYKYCDMDGGCPKRASFQAKGKLRCLEHCLPGMRPMSNVCQVLGGGCSRQSSFGQKGGGPILCTVHKVAGMVQVRTKTCKREGCEKIPSYGFPYKSREYCKSHALADMIYSAGSRCRFRGCSEAGVFHHPAMGGGSFCHEHKEDGMIDSTPKKCQENGCKYKASFGDTVERSRRYCARHKRKGMLKYHELASLKWPTPQKRPTLNNTPHVVAGLHHDPAKTPNVPEDAGSSGATATGGAVAADSNAPPSASLATVPSVSSSTGIADAAGCTTSTVGVDVRGPPVTSPLTMATESTSDGFPSVGVAETTPSLPSRTMPSGPDKKAQRSRGSKRRRQEIATPRRDRPLAPTPPAPLSLAFASNPTLYNQFFGPIVHAIRGRMLPPSFGPLDMSTSRKAYTHLADAMEAKAVGSSALKGAAVEARLSRSALPSLDAPSLPLQECSPSTVSPAANHRGPVKAGTSTTTAPTSGNPDVLHAVTTSEPPSLRDACISSAVSTGIVSECPSQGTLAVTTETDRDALGEVTTRDHTQALPPEFPLPPLPSPRIGFIRRTMSSGVQHTGAAATPASSATATTSGTPSAVPDGARASPSPSVSPRTAGAESATCAVLPTSAPSPPPIVPEPRDVNRDVNRDVEQPAQEMVGDTVIANLVNSMTPSDPTTLRLRKAMLSRLRDIERTLAN